MDYFKNIKLAVCDELQIAYFKMNNQIQQAHRKKETWKSLIESMRVLSM